MISLLLTLFISLFSVCPSVNKLEDHTENEVTIYENIEPKRAMNNGTIYMFNSTYDIYNVFEYAFAKYDIPNFAQGESVTFPNTYQQQFPYCSYSHYNPDNWTQSDFDYYLSYFKLQYLYPYTIQGADGLSYYAFVVQLTCVNDQDVAFATYNIDYFPPYNSNGSRVYASYSVNYNTSNIPRGWFFVDSSTQLGMFEVFTYSNHDIVYQNGYQDGLEVDNTATYNTGYQQGYTQGYNDGVDVDATASTIFTGILDVALIPVNVFLTIFNFEVFGINIGGIVSGLLTLSVVIIILRFLFGGRKDD